MKLEQILKGDFKNSGEIEIHTDVVASKWNHLCFLAQWNEEFRLIRYKQINSDVVTIKIAIQKEQAKELIKTLSLTAFPSMFRSGKSWKRIKDEKKRRDYFLKKKADKQP